MLRTFRSKIPLRFDRWIRLVWQSGQFSIANLLLTHLERRYPPTEQLPRLSRFAQVIGLGGVAPSLRRRMPHVQK